MRSIEHIHIEIVYVADDDRITGLHSLYGYIVGDVVGRHPTVHASYGRRHFGMEGVIVVRADVLPAIERNVAVAHDARDVSYVFSLQRMAPLQAKALAQFICGCRTVPRSLRHFVASEMYARKFYSGFGIHGRDLIHNL